MKNAALIAWSEGLIAIYKERIVEAQYVIDLIDANEMHSLQNGQDTTPVTLERASAALAAFVEGIRVMEKSIAELSTEG